MAQPRFLEVLPVDSEPSVKAKFFFGRLIRVVSQKTQMASMTTAKERSRLILSG